MSALTKSILRYFQAHRPPPPKGSLQNCAPSRVRRLIAQEEGQALVIIAGGMIGIMAFMGIVVDIGWGLYQRRTAQNAADAAALAGIRVIATTDPSACNVGTLRNSIDTYITTYVQENSGSTATNSWHFVDNQGNTVADSDACTATGVSVTADRSYDTFFLSIIGRTQGATSGNAVARVRVLEGFTGGAPFIGCGTSLDQYPSGTTVNVLDTTHNPPGILPQYIGTTFQLHGPQVGQDGADCGAGNEFKGNASDSQNGCSSLPCDYEYQNGTRAGPTQVRVAGAAPGCSGTTWDQCVLIIPLADGLGSISNSLHIVTWAAFLVTEVSANEHTGVLLGVVFTTGPSTDYTVGVQGPLVLTLVE